jgi:tetratricopeptide (TPR) repeat protein
MPTPWVLLLTIAIQGPAADSARATVRAAQDALEAGTLPALESAWRRRLARAPNDHNARLGLGAAEQLTYRFEAAESRLHTLRSAPPTVARQAALILGNILIARGRYEDGRAALAVLSRGAAAAEDSVTRIEADLGRSGVTARLLGAPAASALLDSVAALRPARDPRLEASFECARSSVLGLQGRYREARAAAHTGAAIARRANALRAEGTCLFRLLSMFVRAGETDSVRVVYSRLSPLQRRARDQYGLSATLQWVGSYLISLGQYPFARAVLDSARHAAIAARSPEMQAWVATTQAKLALAFRDLTTARPLVRRSDSLMRAIGDQWGVLSLTQQRALIAVLGGDLPTASALIDTALVYSERLGDPFSRFDVLSQARQLALKKGELERARRFMTDQVAVAERAGMRGWQAGTAISRGELALRQGRLAEADSLLEEAVQVSSVSQHASRHQAHVLRALAKLRRGDESGAVAKAVASAAEFDRWRESLDDNAYRNHAAQSSSSFGDFGIASLVSDLGRRGRIDVALELSERQRARELRDRLVLGAAWTGDTAAAGPHVAPAAVDGLLATMPDDSTAVVHFTLGSSGEPSTAILIAKGHQRAALLPTSDSLAPLVARFVASLESGRPAPALGRQLGQRLLDDVLGDLPSRIGRLVFAPDGVLHRLPFDALQLRDGRHVIERFETAIVPSGGVAAHLWAQPVERVAQDGRLHAYGDPEFGPTPWSVQLPRLPGSREEVRLVSAFTRDATVRLRSAASEAHLKQTSLGDHAVLHLATHALVDDWSITRTGIALSPGDGEDGFFSAGEIAASKVSARLVVLSACRSGGGEILGGEGVRGLAQPFLQGGTRAVVVTAWRIPDRRITRLVGDFYAELSRNRAVGAALRLAKLRARASGAPPSEWGAFTVVGDPFTRVALAPRARAN